MPNLLLASLVVASVTSATPALADGLLELSAGVSTPTGDDGYDALVSSGRQIGLRTGVLHPLGGFRDPSMVWVGGVDVGLSAGTLAVEEEDDAVSFTRYRATVGARLGLQTPGLWAFGRVGAGLDVVAMDNSDLLESLCGDPSTSGLGLEVSLGAAARFGRVFVGGQLGVISSDHGGDRPRCQGAGGQAIEIDVLDYDATEIEIGVVTGVVL